MHGPPPSGEGRPCVTIAGLQYRPRILQWERVKPNGSCDGHEPSENPSVRAIDVSLPDLLRRELPRIDFFQPKSRLKVTCREGAIIRCQSWRAAAGCINAG